MFSPDNTTAAGHRASVASSLRTVADALAGGEVIWSASDPRSGVWAIASCIIATACPNDAHAPDWLARALALACGTVHADNIGSSSSVHDAVDEWERQPDRGPADVARLLARAAEILDQQAEATHVQQ